MVLRQYFIGLMFVQERQNDLFYLVFPMFIHIILKYSVVSRMQLNIH